ncbi:MAG: ATP-dependent DNA helicase RecG [Candidatus Falkowbacteria bacterium]|nr:ATP-dependent DNA helicase RecG [Candidatus Falkowbacteria bacterium]
MLTLNTEITKINRVGIATAKKLKRLGLETVEDLLFYFPFRYDDFTRLTPIDKLEPGISANVVGQVELIQNKRSWKRRMFITEALISDGTETLKVIWFNQPFIAKNLKVGDKVSLAGKIEDDYGGITMISPIYEKVTPPTPLYKGGNMVHTQGLVPNYHLTANITQKQLRFLIKQIINLAGLVQEWLPQQIKNQLGFLSINDAIKKIHFPKNNQDINKARDRLAFNELFLIQLQTQLAIKNFKSSGGVKIVFKEDETKKFVDSLPFSLTDAQRKAAWEIIKDLEKDKPMSRLLEGDVGSGKTLVACLAMLNAALNGWQSAIMAPTEILAKQHYETFNKLFGGLNLKIGLVTSSDKQISNLFKADKKAEDKKITYGNLNALLEKKLKKSKISSKLVAQNADIIVGTHALIQENISFKNLALVIIDEQHRFGVEQRKALTEKSNLGENKSPHLLSMTATPIPRSLALALYGDLAVSLIDELPEGRKKILTKIVEENKRQKAYEFIREQIKSGRQVFVICPLIDISDKLGVKSVKEEYEKLDKKIFPELAIGCLHGKLKPREKEGIMKNFLENKIKILVSTSVVEVGVDVPNATVMMIEGADRFGLAQIHQFRGRVGRSSFQSYCFLFTDSEADRTLKRLKALETIDNGFELAKIDLKFRGPGEMYGTEQKGFPELKIASLFDYRLMKLARDAAEKIIIQDESLYSFSLLKGKFGEMEKKVHLE